MTTNTRNVSNDNAWHFVNADDFRDDAQFHDWTVSNVQWHIEHIIAALTPQHFDPQHVATRFVPARDELMSTFYWIEEVRVYDEIETVNVIGFAYIPSAQSNAHIERNFRDSIAR
jgi:hypothetical protein